MLYAILDEKQSVVFGHARNEEGMARLLIDCAAGYVGDSLTRAERKFVREQLHRGLESAADGEHSAGRGAVFG